MKKVLKKMSCIATACVCAVPILAFTACGASETVYNIVGTDKEYKYSLSSDSTVTVDDGIVIDGKLDEPFYTRKVQTWYRASKTEDDPYNEGGLQASFAGVDLAITTYFTSNAVLIAIDVDTDWLVSYDPRRNSTANSGVELYLTANAPSTTTGNLFEADLCAGGDQRFKVWDGRFVKARMSADVQPLYGIQLKGGEINTPECTGYTMEWYIPYALFGLDEMPDRIDINPFVMTMMNATGTTREWYGFGSMQSPTLCGWNKPTAYPFDSRGFICNHINIEAEGGEVMQERGYDWCVTGDEVTFYLESDNPNAKLTTFKVNGVEMKDKVRNGEIKVKCEGDMNIVAQFA